MRGVYTTLDALCAGGVWMVARSAKSKELAPLCSELLEHYSSVNKAQGRTYDDDPRVQYQAGSGCS
jgi:hypothetical protein